MAPNLQRFCTLVVKSKLASGADLEKHYRNWRADAPDDRDNLPSFIKHLIDRAGIPGAQLERLIAEPAGHATVSADATRDVELVKVRDPRRSLDRRDVVMLLGGMILGGLAVLLPVMLTRKVPVKNSADPMPE
ncbi:MAG: hypothetical protein K1X57_01300 [Gemmataceae bacterium]|nr:hypothetical protein [Gemmataceae bacterium]